MLTQIPDPRLENLSVFHLSTTGTNPHTSSWKPLGFQRSLAMLAHCLPPWGFVLVHPSFFVNEKTHKAEDGCEHAKMLLRSI